MIDTHQHLLYPSRFSYSWTRGLPALQGSFHLEEYRAGSNDCGIEGTVFMEVDVDEEQSGDEAAFFCALAENPDHGILGVIASGRLENKDFPAHLDAIAHPKLKGLRRVLHTQPDALSQSTLFRQNLGLLAERGLTFDLCVLQRQLPVAFALASSCPGVNFILDHCGVPDIAANNAPNGDGFRAWAAGIRDLAALPNVSVKISGLTAYAAEAQRTDAGLRPYFDTILEAFGPSRLVWGSDWPVVNLGSGLAQWCRLTRDLLSSLSLAEQSAILAQNARRIYSLDS